MATTEQQSPAVKLAELLAVLDQQIGRLQAVKVILEWGAQELPPNLYRRLSEVVAPLRERGYK